MGRKLFYITIWAWIILTPKAEASLIGYWPFDEGNGTVAYNSTSSDYFATCIYLTCPNWVDGKEGYALNYDGIDDYLVISKGQELNLSGDELTISAWLKFTDLGGAETIFNRWGSGGQIFLKKWDTDNRLMMQLPGVSGGTPRREFFNNTEVVVGEWIHFAGVYNGNNVQFYYNGYADGTTPASGSISKITEGWAKIGGDEFWNQYFSGSIDELRIYDHALTQQEILYAGGLIPEPVIPEPTTALLLSGGLLGTLFLKKRGNHRDKEKLSA